MSTSGGTSPASRSTRGLDTPEIQCHAGVMSPQKKFYQTPEFRRLEAEWREKLAASGFPEIEYVDRKTGEPGSYLKGISTGDLRRSSHRIATVRETLAFYEAARALVHDDTYWKRKTDRRIWEMYAEGEKRADIQREMNQRNWPSHRKVTTPAHVSRVIREGKAEVYRRLREEPDLEGLE